MWGGAAACLPTPPLPCAPQHRFYGARGAGTKRGKAPVAPAGIYAPSLGGLARRCRQGTSARRGDCDSVKFDTSGIDRAALAAEVRDRHGLPVFGLSLVPKGEDAFAFVDEGRCFFVRAQAGADLEDAMRVAADLRGEAGVAPVLAPRRTRDGTYCFALGRHTVTVFPFVDGVSLWDGPATAGQIADAAGILARVHAAHLGRPPSRRERFDDPFAPTIRRALEAGEGRDAPVARDVRQLLADERSSVLAALEGMDRLGRECRAQSAPCAITHGDPNLANFLLDAGGGLHLTDWGDLALGPVERDLVHFSGQGFARALAAYLAAAGPVPLHVPLFAFYQLWWCVQEIADYTTRILFRNNTPAEDAHDWEELAPHLPVPWDELAQGRERVAEVLRAVGA